MLTDTMPHPEGRGNGAMDSEEVYQTTTEPIKATDSFCNRQYLCSHRGSMKVVQVVLSFMAFFLEELVENCEYCHALYFFEFVSCSAFFLTLLLLVIMATSLKNKVDRVNWKLVDFFYIAVIAILFLIASIVFAAMNAGSSMEKASVVFGFLASFAFIVDVVLYLKEEGVPFIKKETKPTETKSGSENVKGETEPLNEPGNLPV
uniref:CKLF-like MARVEL transmembrane domain-containing protein 6 n=1 Tax=Pristiophorus japonicus TaxID=55135 RepID=UPI00398F6306